MPIKHQDAIDACELVIELSEEAKTNDANVLVLSSEVVKTIHQIADAIRGNNPKK